MAQDRLSRPPSARLSRMLDGVGGNPFFATQILEGVVRAGTEDDPDIPAEFVLGVRRRLGELGPATADLMTIAAVFGQALAAGDVPALLPQHPAAEVTISIGEAVRSGLLEHDRAVG